MDLQEYLDASGYTQSLRDLTAIIGERDRFAEMLRYAQGWEIAKGRRALAALDARIEATEVALADEYEKAVNYMNAVHARDNGVAILNELVPRFIGELDKSDPEIAVKTRSIRGDISH